MNDLHKSRPFVSGLLILFCLVWFYALDARTLVPTDEGRYAEMAREMAASGDWITPRLNGLKYFEKPPLQTWMNALSFVLFGLGEWQARLWTGLCGLLGIGLTAYAGRKMFNERIGFAAGLVLASSFWWAAFAHINTLDMGLAGMMSLVLCGLLLGQRDNAGASERRNWMLACWAGMALAVLSKGLIGVVLPGAVLVLYTLLSRDWAIWKRLHPGLGLLVFFGITAPWFVLVSLQNPEFPHFFFVHEHLQRFTSQVHNRAGPWYYFIPLLLVGIMPWIGVLAHSLWSGQREAGDGFQPKKMLRVWAGFIFFFFSISGSKLPSYILPIFPALALLIAAHLENASRRNWAVAAGLMAAAGAAGLAFVPKIAGMTSDELEIANYQAAQPWAIASFVLLLAGGIVVLLWTRQKRAELFLPATITLAVTGFLAGQLLILSTEAQGRYRAGVLLLPAIEAELRPEMKLYAVETYEQSIPFYLRRTVALVGRTDSELDFGVTQEPHLQLTYGAFFEKWTKGPKALALTRIETFSELEKIGLPMRVVIQDSRRLVIANDVKQ